MLKDHSKTGQLWRHPLAGEALAAAHAGAGLILLQHREIVQHLQVMNSEIAVLHIPPELCKVQRAL